MNTGLLYKGARETLLVTAICGTAIFLFEILVTYVFWTYQEEFTGDFLQIQFVADLINSMVGSRAGGSVGPATLQSLAWVHPIVLSVFFTQAVTSSTRVPAGEIDAGTADILLALPVSRWTIYAHEALVWMGAGLALLTMAFLGNQFGNLLIPSEGRIEAVRVLIILGNLFALYCCVGAIGCFLATRADSRGRAVGGTVGILLTFLIWNFVSQYWSPLEKFDFLNILSYYKPMPILDAGTVPWKDMAVLWSATAVLWGLGGRHFHRRDINTL
jgi:ABC-type transport system involved in multi-copper enzyme maturation permease subunit